MKIPKAQKIESEKRIPNANCEEQNYKVLFSFEAVQKDEYFNLDGTCQNWSMDLFDILKVVSNINVYDIYAGNYSGKNSTLRIHSHRNMKTNPCSIPKNVSIEDMWQIRISKSKGGIHGVFRENVFYVIWFDPHHNLYPDENHGGLRKVIPPSTCCKDRDEENDKLQKELVKLQEEYDTAMKLLFEN